MFFTTQACGPRKEVTTSSTIEEGLAKNENKFCYVFDSDGNVVFEDSIQYPYNDEIRHEMMEQQIKDFLQQNHK